MPIYEYICGKCGSHTEVLQKITDEPLKRCSECRGKLEKIVSRTSFQLKGSGWYQTDYSRSGSGSESKKKDSKESKESKDAKDSKEDKKLETRSSDATCGAGACGACD
jgi:putative FmdB family regulatory protein